MTVAELKAVIKTVMDEESVDRVQGQANQLKGMLTKALGMIGVGFSLAGLKALGKECLSAASEAEQTQQKFEAVFGGVDEAGNVLSMDLVNQTETWVRETANRLGRARQSLRTYMADQGNLLVGFGMAREEAAAMSEQMVEAAINIASFNNIEDDRAVDAMSKALMGQSEAAKILGAVLSDSEIEKAMKNMGLTGKFNALDQNTKMMVRFNAICSQSGPALQGMGDAMLSLQNGNYESYMRVLNAKMLDLKTTIGRWILPFAAKGAQLAGKLIDKVQGLVDTLGDVNQEGSIMSQVWTKANELFDKAVDIFSKVVDRGKALINMLGGVENVAKLVAFAVGAIFANNLLGKIGNAGNLLKTVQTVMGGIFNKTNLTVGAILLLFLMIQDLIYFMNGKGSLFGDMLDMAGFDPDKVREGISTLVNDVKEIGGVLQDKIGEGIQSVMDWVSNPENSEKVKVLAAAALILKNVILLMANPLAGILATITDLVLFFPQIQEFVDGLPPDVKETIKDIKKSFEDLVEKFFEWGHDGMQDFIEGMKSTDSPFQWILDTLEDIWLFWTDPDAYHAKKEAERKAKELVDGPDNVPVIGEDDPQLLIEAQHHKMADAAKDQQRIDSLGEGGIDFGAYMAAQDPVLAQMQLETQSYRTGYNDAVSQFSNNTDDGGGGTSSVTPTTSSPRYETGNGKPTQTTVNNTIVTSTDPELKGAVKSQVQAAQETTNEMRSLRQSNRDASKSRNGANDESKGGFIEGVGKLLDRYVTQPLKSLGNTEFAQGMTNMTPDGYVLPSDVYNNTSNTKNITVNQSNNISTTINTQSENAGAAASRVIGRSAPNAFDKAAKSFAALSS